MGVEKRRPGRPSGVTVHKVDIYEFLEQVTLLMYGRTSWRAATRVLGCNIHTLQKWVNEGFKGNEIPAEFFTEESMERFYAEHGVKKRRK